MIGGVYCVFRRCLDVVGALQSQTVGDSMCVKLPVLNIIG